jgi:hypothetical protein
MSGLSIWKYVVLIVMLVLILACSKRINPSEVAGTYEAHHQNGVETLQLRPDGSYLHEFKSANGTTSDHSGRWKFEPFDGEPKVALYDFSSHFPVSQKRGDILLLDVERDWGRVRLYLSYDLGQYYVNVGSK